ncbi:MarR family winged helix-turn-helix transcriptional regulator [Actinomycetospora termitidis]|uniref:MarR family transcriptional regulator n=1 Tax=Actinomycetospora termitidis TaxID=3053470 RepID=A0ABT7M2Y4_9PSEU|nr:MarR family transcriptional regulator [Actinomycetospora sp. Odt1-22]MDL5155032.1 MarR family transcriptional regulator [Actinomycetospora sp. Odt1-22]
MDLEPDLGLLFGAAHEGIQARLARALGDLDLTARQYCVLGKADSGTLTQGQIAEAALLDKTTMVVTLDALQTAGLARREPHPNDRRARVVVTTAEGSRLFEKAAAVVRGLYDEVLGALPAAQRDVLVEALTSLIATGGPLDVPADDPRPRRSSRRG